MKNWSFYENDRPLVPADTLYLVVLMDGPADYCWLRYRHLRKEVAERYVRFWNRIFEREDSEYIMDALSPAQQKTAL